MDRSGAMREELATVMQFMEEIKDGEVFYKKVCKHIRTILGGGPLAYAGGSGRGR